MPPAAPTGRLVRSSGCLALSAVLALAACESSGNGKCTVTLAAEVPLTLARGAMFAPAMMNDTQTLVLVDTGAETSVVSADALARLHLLGDERHGTMLTGVGGFGWAQNDALLRRYELGGYDLDLGHYAVIDVALGIDDKHPVSGAVGGQILSHFDIDLDIPHSKMTLYTVHHCSGNFLPWTGHYTAVPIETTHADRLIVPVKVNGQNATALLDTGAGVTIIDRPAAERIGVTPEMLAKDKVHNGTGAAGVGFHLTAHQFDSIEIGTERIANPKLGVLDRQLHDADMLLGYDYLRTRRVWISYHSDQVFIATP